MACTASFQARRHRMFDLQIYYELKGEDNRFRQLTPLFPLLFTPYNQKKEKSQPPPYTYLRGLQA